MKKTILASMAVMFFLAGFAQAQGLRHILPELMNQHELIKAAESKRDAALSALDQAWGEWYPSVDLLSEAGQEDIRRTDHSNTSELRNVQTIRGRQLVTDFGRTSGTIDRTREQVEQAKTELEKVRQEVLLEGVSAFLQVVKAREQLAYAIKSEENITRQTGMEETLVKKGAGLSSDVLQIKSQLAGARARRVTARGELLLAKNRFKAVFKRLPTDEEIAAFTLPQQTFVKIPMTMEEATRHALDTNLNILLARQAIKGAEHDLDVRKAAYFPTLNLVVEGKRRENDDGASGIRHEGRAGVEFNYNLFNGGSDSAAIRSGRSEILRLKNMEKNTTDLVEEQIANAWQNLLISRENHTYLENQVVIVKEFLNLARKERKLGTRSLLDVLDGEINFINATSMAVAAHVETFLAAYQLYYAMGNLTLELF
ncbi:TolC family protein [Desulfoplanes sp. PS50]